ncbi:MAG: ribonuclease III [Oscillospiraceae bacterium]|nr:ribonuclease III [Oscillospiraceae bacterium]
MEQLEERIEYHFKDPSLLKTALTHSSYVNEHPAEHAECYERMEFLGDSILGMVTAQLLYRWKPALPEGKMTRIRAELVCEESLHRVAADLRLGQYMRLGKGEERSNGRERPSILADMVEAVIAAVFLDGGMEPAAKLIHQRVLEHAEDYIRSRGRDSKTELQELVQKQPGSSIRYELTGESGPDHNKHFSYAVYVNGVLAGEGEGRTKKEAEQAAAGSALQNRNQ